LHHTYWIEGCIDNRNSGKEDERRVVASGSGEVDIGFEYLRVEGLEIEIIAFNIDVDDSYTAQVNTQWSIKNYRYAKPPRASY